MNAPIVVAPRKPKDYASNQDIRWCPGCGNYAVLKSVQKILAEINADPSQTVFISGIGCSSRFPYYLNTYGFHTIHGRAPAIATGVKLANPELDVWVITGDGDSLSIGGNHLIHVLRRNVDLQILLFNNEIYGLTKGQYSPTSKIGTTSPSSPQGSLETPTNAARLALGAGARFVARAIEAQTPRLGQVLSRARAHRGTSLVEILQNCIVYNDGVFAGFADKALAADQQLLLEHGQPLRFGRDQSKGLRLNPQTLRLEVVTLGEQGVTEADLLHHDETNPVLADLLARLEPPLPMALGVLYCAPAPTYQACQPLDHPATRSSAAAINQLLRTGSTWVSKGSV